MRVGIVLDEYRAEVGGAFAFQAEVFKALPTTIKDSQHEFIILHWPEVDLGGIEGVTFVPLAKATLRDRFSTLISRILPAFHTVSPLERVAQQNAIDFLWFLSPRTRAVGIPYMTIVLDLQHRVQPWFPEVSAGGEWNKRESHYQQLLPRAAAIIVGTQAGKSEVQRFYEIPGERIHILPHPTPEIEPVEEAKAAEILNRFGLQPGYVFYPAQFWTHKNHVNLLAAIAELKAQGKVVDAVFVGSDFGAKKTAERYAKRLGISDQVHFLGFVDKTELAALYQGALALTYVSYFGPENLPPLEAFALKCPVIAADVSGAKEQLGDAALLVDPSDPKTIAAAIREMSNNPARRKDLVSAGSKIADKWRTKDFVEGALKIIDLMATK